MKPTPLGEIRYFPYRKVSSSEILKILQEHLRPISNRDMALILQVPTFQINSLLGQMYKSKRILKLQRGSYRKPAIYQIKQYNVFGDGLGI